MRRFVAGAVVMLVGLTVSIGPASAAISPTSQPFGGTDGRVSAIIKIGNAIYVGGSFTHAYDGSTLVPRDNLAAFDLSGNLLPWNPGANGAVLAFASNGKRLFAGGKFTTVERAGCEASGGDRPGYGWEDLGWRRVRLGAGAEA